MTKRAHPENESFDSLEDKGEERYNNPNLEVLKKIKRSLSRKQAKYESLIDEFSTYVGDLVEINEMAKGKRGKRAGGGKRSAPRSGRTHTVLWWTPPANPPVIIENKWRTARLKISSLAAGDAGIIVDITPAGLFTALKNQQGIDITTALASVRVLGMFSYAFAGVADTGQQVYPSTKIRVYSPMEDSTQGVLIAQREDQGTLDSVARVGFKYPDFLAGRVMNGASTSYFAQLENYHCARGVVFVDCSWCSQPN